MKLEHRRQKVAPISIFILRLLRYGLFASLLILLSLLAGMLSYKYLSNLSWVDSLYMASMILTGMGPVAE